MPSVSPAQHRWIGYLHSNPEARERSGMSQAKVDEWLHSDRGSPWKHATGGIVQHRDDGGSVEAIGGPTPSVQTANPMEQGMIQRYSSMPTEKLTEMAAMMGGSPQGQLIQKLLMQRHLMPQQSEPAQPAYRRGGATPKRDAGGMMSASEASPWWTRREATNADSGFLHGSTPGRADQIKTTAPGGAYVIPADVIAGLGEGNSLAGARVMEAILGSGPHGTPMPRGGGRSTMPHPPAPLHDPQSELKTGGPVPIFPARERKAGGVTAPGNTAVDLSDGEYVVAPHHVDRIGGGDRKRGHRILDKWVVAQREKHIAKLKKLPGPVKI